MPPASPLGAAVDKGRPVGRPASDGVNLILRRDEASRSQWRQGLVVSEGVALLEALPRRRREPVDQDLPAVDARNVDDRSFETQRIRAARKRERHLRVGGPRELRADLIRDDDLNPGARVDQLPETLPHYLVSSRLLAALGDDHGIRGPARERSLEVTLVDRVREPKRCLRRCSRLHSRDPNHVTGHRHSRIRESACARAPLP
jgi:hypothetical protein